MSLSDSPFIIIRAALAGNQYGQGDNPNIPFGRTALINDAVACVDAGAAELHIHLRNEQGTPVFDPQEYLRLRKGIYKALRDRNPTDPAKWNPVISFTTTQRGIETTPEFEREGRPTALERPAAFAVI